MKKQVIRFSFRNTSLHLGSVREDYTRSESILHSDTLYAAILHAWSVLGIGHPMLEQRPDATSAAPDLGFTLSSLFPFFRPEGSGRVLYFFPMPLCGYEPRDKTLKKNFKALRFLDVEAFCSWLETGKMPEQKQHLHGAFYTDRRDFDPTFLQRSVHPRAFVPREGAEEQDTVIYYIERLFFRECSGLFCLIQFDDDDIREKVLIALQHLQDEGLGTDRHVGHGQFELEGPEAFTLFDALPQSPFALNLSLFCPENKTRLENMIADEKKTSFELLKRGGWITAEPWLTYRKNSVYMFREGSVFQTADVPDGRSVDLQPNILANAQQAVWRVGKSLFVPVQKT